MLRKSQVTVFIIIVLVIMVMFGITYYIIGLSTEQAAEENILRQQISSEKIGPFNEYVKSCLSLASSEGLELLGKQGGYLYESQGGMIADPPAGDMGKEYIDQDGAKVHYCIYAPISDVGTIFFARTPSYPWRTFPEIRHPVTNELIKEEYLEGYYGRNRILPFEKPLEKSWQEQLEKFAITSTLTCIDWTPFNQQGLDITPGQANLSVLFAEGDVTFRLDWPLEVTDRATGAVTDLDEFIVTYPIRLRKIHNFASIIMDKDTGNISYDIRVSDGTTTATTVQDVFGKDDFVVIRDSESRILDEEYVFQFARKNRAPALYFIENATEPICNASLIQWIPPNVLNVEDSCGDNSFRLNFTAVDPDEDRLEFTYNKRLPYEIEAFDVIAGKFNIRITVSDGELTDWQEISIPVINSDDK